MVTLVQSSDTMLPLPRPLLPGSPRLKPYIAAVTTKVGAMVLEPTYMRLPSRWAANCQLASIMDRLDVRHARGGSQAHSPRADTGLPADHGRSARVSKGS